MFLGWSVVHWEQISRKCVSLCVCAQATGVSTKKQTFHVRLGCRSAGEILPSSKRGAYNLWRHFRSFFAFLAPFFLLCLLSRKLVDFFFEVAWGFGLRAVFPFTEPGKLPGRGAPRRKRKHYKIALPALIPEAKEKIVLFTC